MQRAGCLEAIGMCGNAAHCMHRNRAADDLVVTLARHVGPGLVDNNFFFKRDAGDFGGQIADRLCGNAGLAGNRFRRVIGHKIFLRHQFQHWHSLFTGTNCTAIRQSDRTGHARCDIFCLGRLHRAVGDQHQRGAVAIARNQTMILVAQGLHHQPGGVGIAIEIIQIDFAQAE